MHVIRDAEPSDVERMAAIWYDGWQDAHAAIVPAELARVRTLASFTERLHAGLADTRVVGPHGAPHGFCMLKGDELYQLYVAAAARGSGAAVALITDGEQRMAARGVPLIWLGCAIGNDRAARFYAKQGWVRACTTTIQLETTTGDFPLELWRYEKALLRGGIPPAPWSVVYADGAANVYRFESAAGGARFVYEPMTAARSSTGRYDGGRPLDLHLDETDPRLALLWCHVHALTADVAHHATARMKGDGALSLHTAAGTTSLLVARAATRHFEALLEQAFRTP